MSEPDQIAGLMSLRAFAKALFESEVAQPHERTHLWAIIGRIDSRIKEKIDDRINAEKEQDQTSND
jgi:hypothetical protein